MGHKHSHHNLSRKEKIENRKVNQEKEETRELIERTEKKKKENIERNKENIEKNKENKEKKEAYNQVRLILEKHPETNKEFYDHAEMELKKILGSICKPKERIKPKGEVEENAEVEISVYDYLESTDRLEGILHQAIEAAAKRDNGEENVKTEEETVITREEKGKTGEGKKKEERTRRLNQVLSLHMRRVRVRKKLTGVLILHKLVPKPSRGIEERIKEYLLNIQKKTVFLQKNQEGRLWTIDGTLPFMKKELLSFEQQMVGLVPALQEIYYTDPSVINPFTYAAVWNGIIAEHPWD